MAEKKFLAKFKTFQKRQFFLSGQNLASNNSAAD